MQKIKDIKQFQVAFEAIVHDEVKMKNTKFIKGRHRTQLDKTSLQFIKDIARPHYSFEKVLEHMNRNYRIGIDEKRDF